MERPEIRYEDRAEEVYVVNGTGEAYVSREQAEQQGGLEGIEALTLHRPGLVPTYGGPTLVEALWAEMDRLMEALMTGQAAEGDKYRAEELAWVLAIVTNPYEPSMDRIRAETMDRWNAQQSEPAGGSTLNSEDQ